jgi:hypothetical protein
MLLGLVVVDRRRMSEVEYIPDEYCWVQLEDSNMSQEIEAWWMEAYGGPWLEASRRASSITGGIEVDGTS